jgi:hypothetical protein
LLRLRPRRPRRVGDAPAPPLPGCVEVGAGLVRLSQPVTTTSSGSPRKRPAVPTTTERSLDCVRGRGGHHARRAAGQEATAVGGAQVRIGKGDIKKASWRSPASAESRPYRAESRPYRWEGERGSGARLACPRPKPPMRSEVAGCGVGPSGAEVGRAGRPGWRGGLCPANRQRPDPVSLAPVIAQKVRSAQCRTRRPGPRSPPPRPAGGRPRRGPPRPASSDHVAIKAPSGHGAAIPLPPARASHDGSRPGVRGTAPGRRGYLRRQLTPAHLALSRPGRRPLAADAARSGAGDAGRRWLPWPADPLPGRRCAWARPPPAPRSRRSRSGRRGRSPPPRRRSAARSARAAAPWNDRRRRDADRDRGRRRTSEAPHTPRPGPGLADGPYLGRTGRCGAPRRGVPWRQAGDRIRSRAA